MLSRGRPAPGRLRARPLHRLPPLARLVSCVRRELDAVPRRGGLRLFFFGQHGGQGHIEAYQPRHGHLRRLLAVMDDPAGRATTTPSPTAPTAARATPSPAACLRPGHHSMAGFPLCPDCAREYADPPTALPTPSQAAGCEGRAGGWPSPRAASCPQAGRPSPPPRGPGRGRPRGMKGDGRVPPRLRRGRCPGPWPAARAQHRYGKPLAVWRRRGRGGVPWPRWTARPWPN